MIRFTLNCRFWIIQVCLLAFLLSSLTAEWHWTKSSDDFGADTSKIAYAFEAACAPFELSTDDERTHSNTFDHQSLVFHGQAHLIFDRGFSVFLSKNAKPITLAFLSSTPIRAPPTPCIKKS